jgi:hypothetical protein
MKFSLKETAALARWMSENILAGRRARRNAGAVNRAAVAASRGQ